MRRAHGIDQPPVAMDDAGDRGHGGGRESKAMLFPRSQTNLLGLPLWRQFDRDPGTTCPTLGRLSRFTCLAVVLSGLAGCQTFQTEPRGLGDAALVTGNLAHSAATADPTACPPTNDPDCERPPAELCKVALPTYRLEAPDILIVGLVTTTPKEPYYIHSLDILRIIAAGTLEEEPIAGDYQVQPGGLLNLGPSYGTVMLQGLTIAEARDAIARQLQAVIPVPEVSLSLVQAFGVQELNNTKIVGPDGTVNLGVYGNVPVAGLT
ncbi:MAG TPA: polysaccharide biosynthesis/export family protein, partial [Pirellulaceae bacterium]